MRFAPALLAVVLCASIANAQPAPATTSSPAGKNGAKSTSGTPRRVGVPPEKAAPIRVPRVDNPPVIDGKLDDAIWKQAIVLKDFYQIQPGDNIAPSKPTEAYIAYDPKFLYIAFRAYDDPSKIRATLAKRDAIFDDDYVGVFFDTFNDSRRAYEFNFNPHGIQADGILTDGQGEDFSFDVVCESKGIITDDGYTVEVAIPFKSLRYEAGKGKLWGAHFYRRIKRFDNELDMWMPIDRDKSNWLAQSGKLTGFDDLSTERTLEITPSLTLSETGRRVRSLPVAALTNGVIDPGRLVNEPIKFEPGLTLKLGITPTVTLDFAANPDFAQVEADQTVVTANQRFPIFFEEKRPFFLEGKDIFNTRIAAVHTRAIVDPDLAVKFTGKLGKNSFGFIAASDNAPGNFSDDEINDPDNFRSIEKFVGKNAFIGVIRLKRDIGTDSHIGLLGTSYNFIEKHNQVGGIDGRFRIDKQTVFDFQILGSMSRRNFYDPELDRSLYRNGNGFIYAVSLDKDGRHFGFFAEGVGRTRDYRSDVGFNRRTNTNNEIFFVRYNSEPKPKAKLISWRVQNFSAINFDWQGRIQSWNEEPQINFKFPMQGFFGTGYSTGYERIFEEEFGATRRPAIPGVQTARGGAFFGLDNERSALRKGVFAYGGITPSKKYSFFGFFGYDRGSLDYDFGGGRRFPRVSPAALADPDSPLDPGAGTSLRIESNLEYKPINALRLSLSYNKERLRRNDTGRLAFDENIFSFRSTYQFTRFIFLRLRADYSTLNASVRGQFLFGWTPNPGTALYVGYNDDMNRNGFNPFTDHFEPGLRRNQRTFFIKMSYLFRRSF